MKEKESVYGGINNEKKNIIHLWTNYIEELISNGSTIPNYLRSAVQIHMKTRNSIKENNLDTLMNYNLSNEEEFDEELNEENNDWMEGLDENEIESKLKNEIDDINDIIIKWDKDHDFYNLIHNYNKSFNIEEIDERYKEVIKSERIVNRRSISSTKLNFKQKYAHDLIIEATQLKFDESISEGGEGVSRLLLILGKGGCGKSFVLDAAITTLKNKFSYTDENYLVMAPTGKAASNVCGSTLHSHKEGLALQLTGAYKKLQGKSLAYLQKKYFNKLEIIFIDEWPMIS